jgi:hypothetical protein
MDRDFSDRASASTPSGSTKNATASEIKPSRFKQLMSQLAQTKQLPIDLQPISPAPPVDEPTTNS